MRRMSQRSLPMPMIIAAPRHGAPLVHRRAHRAHARARPTKIASPIRKWPMLSSTISRQRGDRARRVEVEAVAGVAFEAERRRLRAPRRAGAPNS